VGGATTVGATGNISTSTFTINILDRSEVVANNDVNFAAISSSGATTTTLYNFNSLSSLSSIDVNKFSSLSVLNSNKTSWLSTSVVSGSNTADASVNSSTSPATSSDKNLLITDRDGKAGSGSTQYSAAVVTPEITVTTASASNKATLSFKVESVSNISSTDSYFYKVFKADSSGNYPTDGTVVAYSGSYVGSNATVQTINIDITAPGNYRLGIYVSEVGSTSTLATIQVDDIALTQGLSPVLATGNILSNDRAGSEGATLSVYDYGQSKYVDVTGASAQVITTQYGTLSIDNTGLYTYTPISTSGINNSDAINYKLTQSDGDVSTSSLTIYIADTTVGGSSSGDTYTTAISTGVVMYGGDGADSITSGTGADVLGGGAGNDVLSADAGNDVVIGGAGADTITLGAGTDNVNVQSGESLATIGGSGTSGTIAGYDIITDFAIADDTLTLSGAPVAATDVAGLTGVASTLEVTTGNTIKSHAISNGMITFSDATTYSSGLTLDSIAKVAAAAQYLHNNDLGDAGVTVAFTATLSSVATTFVYQQVETTPDATKDILIQLSEVSITDLSSLKIVGTAAPIALDLNDDGIHYLDRSSGVEYDFNGDGLKESTAWVGPEDGLLGIKQDDGHIKVVFSTQKGESDLTGLAKVYDANHDGVLDAKDVDFSKFGVWKDSNSDATVGDKEFVSLTDAGITNLSLTSDNQPVLKANGDVFVHGQMTYKTVDGLTHIAEDALFTVNNLGTLIDPNPLIIASSTTDPVDPLVVSTKMDSSQVDVMALLKNFGDLNAQQSSAIDTTESNVKIELGGLSYDVSVNVQLTTDSVFDKLASLVVENGTSGLSTHAGWTEVIDQTAENASDVSCPVSAVSEATDWTEVVASDAANMTSSTSSATESISTTSPVVSTDTSTTDPLHTSSPTWHP
jgi:hypothetical protein